LRESYVSGSERESKKANNYGREVWLAGHRTIGSLLDKRRVTRRKREEKRGALLDRRKHRVRGKKNNGERNEGKK